MATADYLPSLRPQDRLVPSASPPPTELTAIYNTNEIGCCHRPPGAKLVPMSVIMLKSTVLLKEVMKMSDHSTASLVAPHVVAMDALGAS
jgi:hypothetical protein